MYIPIVNGAVTRHIRLMADGRFGVDTSDLEPIVGAMGYLYYTDREGNSVTCPFTIRGYPQYLPLIRLLATAP